MIGHVAHLLLQCLNLLIIVTKFLIRFFESVSYLSFILMMILFLQTLFFLAFFVPHNFWMKDIYFCGLAETEIILLSRYVYTFPSIDLQNRVLFNIFRSWTRFDVIVAMVTIIAYQILSFCRDQLMFRMEDGLPKKCLFDSEGQMFHLYCTITRASVHVVPVLPFCLHHSAVTCHLLLVGLGWGVLIASLTKPQSCTSTVSPIIAMWHSRFLCPFLSTTVGSAHSLSPRSRIVFPIFVPAVMKFYQCPKDSSSSCPSHRLKLVSYSVDRIFYELNRVPPETCWSPKSRYFKM